MRFERATRYDEFATAQKYAAKKLAELLRKHARTFHNAYEIGCGSGIFTRELERFDIGRLTLNDLYSALPMQSHAAQVGDIREIELPRNLDLVASSSVLQWVDDLDALFEKIRQAMLPRGIFAFAMFSEGTLSELSSFTGQGLDYKSDSRIQSIAERNFRVLEASPDVCRVSFQNLHDLLDSLKQTGVNNLDGTFRLTRNSLQKMREHFAENYFLTYRFQAIVAQKIN